MESFEHGRRSGLSEGRAIIGRQPPSIPQMLNSIDTGDQFQWVRHAAVQVLERDELAPGVRETPHFDRVRDLAVEEPTEYGRGISLHVPGPSGEKRPGPRGAFSGRRVPEEHVAIVTDVGPHRSDLDVLGAPRIQDLQAGRVGAHHGRGAHARRQGLDQGLDEDADARHPIGECRDGNVGAAPRVDAMQAMQRHMIREFADDHVREQGGVGRRPSQNLRRRGGGHHEVFAAATRPLFAV
jgi:hypothetical protein